MRNVLKSASRVALIVAVSCGLCLAADGGRARAAHHWPHVHFGGVAIGAGYGYYGGPFWGYPYWGGYPYGGFYSPLFYSPYIESGYYSGYSRAPGYGEVKLKSLPKDAKIFINGAYAGSSDTLKQMKLRPGVYRLEVKQGEKTWKQKIYVLSGKRVDITPQLVASVPSSEQPEEQNSR